MTSHNALYNYGISLLGAKIDWVGMTEVSATQTYNYVDNSFIQILLANGLIFFLILIYMLNILMSKMYINKQKHILYCLLFIGVHSLLDPQLLHIVIISRSPPT